MGVSMDKWKFMDGKFMNNRDNNKHYIIYDIISNVKQGILTLNKFKFNKWNPMHYYYAWELKRFMKKLPANSADQLAHMEFV